MCVLNEERWVSLAMESILCQTRSDFEFIITDDGSTDKTFEIISGYKDDSRVRIIRHPTRKGLAVSLNEQIHQTRGKYIARMDGDDIANPERLAKQVAYLDRHPDAGLLGSFCREIDSKGNHIGVWRRPVSDKALRRAIMRYNPFIHSSVMLPRQVFLKTGLYNEGRAYAQDYDLWLRVSMHYQLSNLPEPLIDLRVDWKKMNRKNREARKCELQIMRDHIFAGPFPKYYYFYLIRPLLLSVLPTELTMRLKEIQRYFRLVFFSSPRII